MHRKARSAELLDCIQSCKDCHDTCVDTAAYCLTMGGHHAAAKHMRLLLDCAQVCTTSEDYMLRDSEFYAQLCSVCADVCDVCAAACDRFSGDQQMEECVSACQTCAVACRTLTALQAAHGAEALQNP